VTASMTPSEAVSELPSTSNTPSMAPTQCQEDGDCSDNLFCSGRMICTDASTCECLANTQSPTMSPSVTADSAAPSVKASSATPSEVTSNSPSTQDSNPPSIVSSSSPTATATTSSPSTTGTAQPPPCGCTDLKDPLTGNAWFDSDGATFNCAWYAQDGNCASYGSSYANFGFTANQACCECGGGTNECTPPTPAPTPPPVEVPCTCVNDPDGWYDADGITFNCAWYAQGSNCASYGSSYANFGATANQACCACGGGSCS
jgi:hypothetical protein